MHESESEPPASSGPHQGLEDPSRSARSERAEPPRPGPRIWVGSWLDYQSGTFHGVWLDAARDEVEIATDIEQMLAQSPTAAQTDQPATAWSILAAEGFGALRVGEDDPLDWVSAVARGIAQHGLAFAAYAKVMEDIDSLPGFAAVYLGHFDSIRAYAEQLVNDLGYERLLDEVLPSDLRRYVRIDVDRMAHDLQVGGNLHLLSADDNGVWLFRSG